MGKDSFSFRKFSIRQDRTAMKVGTDGVLLGAWTPVSPDARVLDIGTGTGLIALQMAQRLSSFGNGFSILGIDIDIMSADQARENAQNSDWSGNIRIENSDFLEMDEESEFDIIVSNPPFYSEDTECPDRRRQNARHSSSLPFEDLILKASRLLGCNGVLSLIFPTSALDDILFCCLKAKLFPVRQTTVFTKPGAESKRTLLLLGKDSTATAERDSLVLYRNGTRTDEYERLVSDFYLKQD